jgi:hypothetical protein
MAAQSAGEKRMSDYASLHPTYYYNRCMARRITADGEEGKNFSWK